MVVEMMLKPKTLPSTASNPVPLSSRMRKMPTFNHNLICISKLLVNMVIFLKIFCYYSVTFVLK